MEKKGKPSVRKAGSRTGSEVPSTRQNCIIAKKWTKKSEDDTQFIKAGGFFIKKTDDDGGKNGRERTKKGGLSQQQEDWYGRPAFGKNLK